MKKAFMVLFTCFFLALSACGYNDMNSVPDEPEADMQSAEDSNTTYNEDDNQTILIAEDTAELDAFSEKLIDNCYCKELYRGGNHYYIDNGVLYGTGNDSAYGQLGIIAPNPVRVSEPIGIAENVVHVDYSGEYFLIYLTAEHELYGIGADVAGIFSGKVENTTAYEYNAVREPFLIMENVQYARCGSDTILVLNKDGELFFYGNDNIDSFNVVYQAPHKVADNVIFMSTFFSSYAYITDDGNLYTFGVNTLGQCGTGTFDSYIDEPVQIADNVSCVWMGAPGFTHGEIEIQYMDYLLVKKEDGTFWATGESIGNHVTEVYDDGIPEKQIASSKLVQVTVQQYQSLDLTKTPFGTSKEAVRDYLFAMQKDVQDTTDDAGNPIGLITNDGIWTFDFDKNNALVCVSNELCDSFCRDMLTFGATDKQVEAAYGVADEIITDDYGYEMHYQMEQGTFIVRFYDGLGAAQFRLEHEQ